MSAKPTGHAVENAMSRYQKANIVAVRVGFNRRTEPELVERIEREESKATYLKRLVWEDIQRERRMEEQDESQ